jgi:hypothetical protein
VRFLLPTIGACLLLLACGEPAVAPAPIVAVETVPAEVEVTEIIVPAQFLIDQARHLGLMIKDFNAVDRILDREHNIMFVSAVEDKEAEHEYVECGPYILSLREASERI